jgi:hypothetical protein
MTKKQICTDCVSDDGIKEFIQENASTNECSYCDKTSKTPIAAPASEVICHIVGKIEEHYEDPAENVGYDSAEGGYLLDTTEAWDLISEVGLEDSNEDFLEELSNHLSDHDWVRKDPYGTPPDEALAYSWDSFSRQVMHQCRFVFFKTKTKNLTSVELEPFEILDAIGEFVRNFPHLQLSLPSGTSIYRARQHDVNTIPNSAATLGPPKKEFASQSRMSPAGIPMFYGAADERTAFLEVFDDNPTKPRVTFGSFELIRDLVLLDLTNLLPVPSIFEDDDCQRRDAFSFLRYFECAVTKVISKGDACHYLYVPTQVVAEYFRHVFTLSNGRMLDGITFNSSKKPGGKCYTLFLNDDGCTDDPKDATKTLVLKSFKACNINFSSKTFFQ